MTKILLYQCQWLLTLIVFICGMIGTLSFSPFDIWLAALVSLFGLQLLILNCSLKQACFRAFIWGIGLFGSGIHWLYVSMADFTGMPMVANVFLLSLLTAYLSIYIVLFTYLLNRFFPRLNIARFLFAAPAIWQITEYLRGWILTGFPWLQFGYSQIDGPLKCIAPIFGVEMISMQLLIISSLLVFFVIKGKPLIYIISAISLLFLPRLLTNYHWTTPITEKTTLIVLVQGNIPPILKWHPGFFEANMRTYYDLSKHYFGRAHIIIWPELAIPSIHFIHSPWIKLLDQILRLHNTSLITGIMDVKSSKQGISTFFNSLIVLGDKQPYQYPTSNIYYKHHLVPFGEFWPLATIFQPISPFVMSNFSSGAYQQKQLTAGNIHLTAAICYEIILGSLVRDNIKPDTDLLLTVLNDAWFGNSIGPWQHFQMARMRALELGRPLLIATNNGVTAVISANGDIQAKLPQFTSSVLNTEVIPTSGMTPYARWSNWPMWTLVMIFIILACVLRNKK